MLGKKTDLFGYTEYVLKNKPIREPGQDVRDLPTYTIPEAAYFLGIPERTARYWFAPHNKILKASGHVGAIALLSFRDLTEAYILAVLTKFYEYRLASLRDIVAQAKMETSLARPLIDADLKVLFHSLIVDKPSRGRRRRQCVDLSGHRNLVFPEFVDQLGRRIMKDKQNSPIAIFPWRLVTTNDVSRPVSIDPDIVSGRLVVTGTRIPVSVLVGKSRAGKSNEEIGRAYSISPEIVEKALLHVDRPIRKKAA